MPLGVRALNGDLSVRVAVDTAGQDWTPSAAGHVLRKRLHRVGDEESGQVTSVVRYEPASTFPAHDHPEGEEFLVLAGTFSDEHGDWPAGHYLLNPEGFRHAPFSREGCLIFVKLRQYAGARRHVCIDTHTLRWEPTAQEGVEIRTLYWEPEFPEEMRLERWGRGTALAERAFSRGAELFVIDGTFEDEEGRYRAGAWLRLPPGSSHQPRTVQGCTVYLKVGGVAGLRSG